MKRNLKCLNKQTKYFKQYFSADTHQFELIEIPLNKDNWWYVQIDASIRYVFHKYDLPIPKYVVIEEVTHFITFRIFRENIKNPKELKKWNNKWIFVYDELKHQAECNSSDTDPEDEHWVKYEFKLL